MRRLIVLLVLIGAAVWAAVALATPGHGQTNTILSVGTLQADLAFNTGLTAQANGLTWRGKQYSADQLPEFLMQLRTAGVTNVGEWLNLHPAVSAKFGMVPVGLLHSPEVVTQQARFAPGAVSGWHSHPGYLSRTVVSGQLPGTAPTARRRPSRRASRSTRPLRSTFVVRNESNTEAVDTVTFVVPGGTPTTGLRVDKPQPTNCSK